MRLMHKLQIRMEAALCRAGLVATPEWSEVVAKPTVKLYAGDLPPNYQQYSDFYGITPFRPARRNIDHDLTQPFPIPDNTVDVFQAEDVFEHIPLADVPAIFAEIHRVLKPGGLFRFSVPDYNFDHHRDRSLKDDAGNVLFDPKGGGSFEDGQVSQGGHLWFPTIASVRTLFESSPFNATDYLQYYEESGKPNVQPVDHSLAYVRRSAENDKRGGSNPVSIIVDAHKDQSVEVATPADAESIRSPHNTGEATANGKTENRNFLLRSLKALTPPIVVSLVRRVLDREKNGELFWGDNELFKAAIANGTSYAEYGCGQSTVWVSRNTTLPISSVDTSAFWIENVRDQLAGRDQVELKHVDLGPLGDWGRPLDYTNRAMITEYTEAHFSNDKSPDVILVDGRFRVACFLASLLHAEPGSIILFDDYTDRGHYHVVEEFVQPSGSCGRQARFVVPGGLQKSRIRSEYEKFLYVMD